ncbi:c-type cytochrome [Paraburkholderia fungorum]|uniref:Mono/diheme cytochrome c family protein n=1 Tax=Paraburkholderia fungorum TaxID=134537 RepID=A0AAW3USU7_9BURK|nr:cytochrome c [Paraburkholderia fungorum]MBB4513173.1 mono/diheme cytochrome c family protein [Paraburkholderia fungorum]MBB6201401.1 mono/diheme cytochrome c family protein [Paraburkholderia fungorum]MBU7438823.1 cytochrome c [Paraburkholderia fungorum]
MLSLRSRIATIVATVAALFLLLVAAGLAFMYSGVYDVSASSKDNPLVAKLLHGTYEASLHRHAGSDVAPGDLLSFENIRSGARMYDSTCALCHGAPDRPLSATGQGIQPAAPSLLSASRRNKPALMFWTIKHGVNMTAMPSFGKTQSDQAMWQVAAFIYAERGISKNKYDELAHGDAQGDNARVSLRGPTPEPGKE